jgi:phosphoserine phosphatase
VALTRFAAQFDVPLSQTVAVGDGIGDIDMLGAAGLGIAINAKPTGHAPDAAASASHLDTVLFVLGISDADVVTAQA